MSAKDYVAMPWTAKMIAEFVKDRLKVELKEFSSDSLVRKRYLGAGC